MLVLKKNNMSLSLRITYIGADLLSQGGDWEELERKGMPTRLQANGHCVHDYLPAPDRTEPQDFVIPSEAWNQDTDTLNLIFEPEDVSRATIVCCPHPIAELWLICH